jgi:hypothetical protein
MFYFGTWDWLRMAVSIPDETPCTWNPHGPANTAFTLRGFIYSSMLIFMLDQSALKGQKLKNKLKNDQESIEDQKPLDPEIHPLGM